MRPCKCGSYVNAPMRRRKIGKKMCNNKIGIAKRDVFVWGLVILILTMLIFFICSTTNAGEKYNPHFGNIEPKTCEQYQEMQSYTHIYGSVIISGQLIMCDGVFESLDLGSVRFISGFLYVTSNPRLKSVDAFELLHASYVVFAYNPFLLAEEADAIGNQVHCGGGVSCIESGHYSEAYNAP